MPNEAHLEILRRGVEAWNRWRAGNPKIVLDLIMARLRGANLREADLGRVNLSNSHLSEADFSGATVGRTVFGNNDLSAMKGLDTVEHQGPSTVGVDTLFASGGNIPPAFLRGCGLADWQIEAAKLYNPDLTNEQIMEYNILDLSGWDDPASFDRMYRRLIEGLDLFYRKEGA